ncbi:MAG: lipopolysaccharide heptosyltransferase II [Chloroflexi bacterium]|nr:lipopolysaccharide heptosyltransferase II [Chloroflexota bacterium]MCL5074454.1 lipopolysaccharide heptosyltransferase II [Chloroflexota bacterium]
MATPTLAALQRQFPQARLGFAVSAWSRAVIEGHPAIKEIVDCGRVGSGARFTLGEYLALIKSLRRGRWDCAFVLDRSLWISLLPFLAGIPIRIGLDSEGRGFPLTLRVPCRPGRHEAELYLDTVRAIGILPQEARLSFYPSPEDHLKAEEALSSVGTKGTRLLAIHPGGGSNPGMTLAAKRWLPERFATVADRAVESLGVTILLVGGLSDGPLATQVQNSMRYPAVDLVGGLTLGQLGAVIQRCALFVGNDTGPMHLAVAVGTPLVAIFGPSDPGMYGPYTTRAKVVRSAEPCSPCFRNGAFPPCPVIRCMAAISVADVWSAVEEQWALFNNEGQGDEDKEHYPG